MELQLARIWDCVKNERLRLNSAIKQGNKKKTIWIELNTTTTTTKENQRHANTNTTLMRCEDKERRGCSEWVYDEGDGARARA
jgi:hypothetical protein